MPAKKLVDSSAPNARISEMTVMDVIMMLPFAR